MKKWDKLFPKKRGIMQVTPCCSNQTHQVVSTLTLIAALALLVMSVAMTAGAFGHQGKYFIMAGCFIVGSIPLFCYTAAKNCLCQPPQKT